MNIYRQLEFDTVLNTVGGFAHSEVVAKKIAETTPLNSLADAEKLLTQTSDALNVLASRSPALAFDDLSIVLDKATVGATLTPGEFLKIRKSIVALRSLKACIEGVDGFDSLKAITTQAQTCDDLESAISSAIESETEIKDGASEKLFSVRRAILRANSKLKERLDGYTRQSEISKYLQDNIVTLRGGRYVIPVRSECRSNVKGLVHDVSSTGATVFIEPFAVVEANNELITLKTEEQNEIERILFELSKKVRVNISELFAGQDVLTECGIIFAKAEYAKHNDAYRPSINGTGKICLLGARHPLISAEKVVPVDIKLDDKRLLVISGPNTGGKTVALKTVGLFALMTASGIFIPTEEGSEMCIFDDIYCDIGDSQSIAQSLSTFSAHITNLSYIMSNMKSASLVLLDEVGDGTDPEEGAALAIAIIKKIIEKGAVGVVTTHFNSVKEFAVACADIANASMQFDNVNFKPTYKLLQGVSGSSYALEIADKLGLDKDIVSDARAALSVEKIAFDAVMREAEKLRNEMQSERDRYAALRREAEADAEKTRRLKCEYDNKLAEINNNARTLIRRSADVYAERAENIIEEIKAQLQKADETALFTARKKAKEIYDGVPTEEIKPSKSTAPPSPADLEVGTRVFISGLNKEGIIASPLHGKKAIVAIGSVKTEIPVSSLSIIREETKGVVRTHVKREIEPENREVMMLGLTVDDATQELDRILSDIAPHSSLRIVHGKGTGALGKGIQAYLKRHNRVKTFRYGRYGEGDTGVTIVEIK